MPLNGSEFFGEFVNAFVKAADREDTTTWLYYQKGRRVQAAGSDLLSSDWTPMIITFLDLLAWKLNFVQLYERPIPGVRNWNRDCIWVREVGGDPLVTIEPENVSKSVFDSEVPKLFADDSPLKVLITYPPDDYGGKGSAEEWQEEFLPELHSAIVKASRDSESKEDIQFLLIVGDSVWWNPLDWYGHLLQRRDGRWDSDWSPLDRSQSGR